MKLQKFLLTTLFFITSLYANNLCILKEHNSLESCKKNIEYFIDKQSLYEDPLKIPSQLFQPNNNKTFLGHIPYPIWSKLDVQYKGKKEQSFVFVNPKVTINNLTVTIYDKNNKLIKKEVLGDINPIELRELKSRYSAFKITLKPNETITIITHIKHTGATDIAWLPLPLNIFENFIIKESTIIGILIGILFAIIFYNLLLYLRLKDKIYLFYLFHITAAFLFQISTTNLFYEFNIILGGFFPWIIASLGIASLILFAKYFFNTKITAPKINKFLIIMISITFLLGIYFTIASFFPDLMHYRKLILIPLITLTTVLMIVVAVLALYKKLTGALYYTFGQVGYLICFMVPQFSNLLQAELSFIIIYIATFGVLLDVIFLSLALSKKIEDIKNENEKNEKLLLSQGRFASIGKSIATVSHQWKTPLAHISISVVNLEAYLYKTKNNDRFFQEFVDNMRNSINFMSSTIKDINDFYLSSHTAKEKFYLIDSIKFVKKLLEQKICNTKVKISIDINKSVELNTYKNILGNIIMILMDNSLDMVIKRDIKNPTLNIKAKLDKDKFILTFEDNAGGIELKPIEKVFDEFTSTKTTSGLGLSIAKSLVENQLKGSIKVKNKKDGACFEVCLKTVIEPIEHKEKIEN